MSEFAPLHAVTASFGAAGRLDVSPDGRFEWVSDQGGVRAGDGLASAIVDLLTAADARSPVTDAGRLRVELSSARHADRSGSARERERSLDVDQTNLSVVVDDSVVLKFVGAWGTADRAVRALLALDGSGIAPGFRGAMLWDLPGVGETTVAVATELLEGTVDGWTWAVDDVLARLDCPGASRSAAGTSPDPEWPEALGALTARLHQLLAADAVPGSVRGSDAADAVRDTVRRARAALGNSDTGLRVAARSRALDDVAAEAETVGDLRLPLFLGHDDLHVGQVLRAPDADPADVSSYRVIDFDGDPQASEDERDRPVSVLVDLAHLSTSIDMVASVVQRRRGEPDGEVQEWAVRARRALFGSYRTELGRLGAEHLIGDDPQAFELLLAASEVEHLAREIVYATRFLPRWLYAPDGAVTARFTADPDLEDPPWTPPASPTTSA